MKTSILILILSLVLSVTLLGLRGVLTGNQVLQVLELLVVGGAGAAHSVNKP